MLDLGFLWGDVVMLEELRIEIVFSKVSVIVLGDKKAGVIIVGHETVRDNGNSIISAVEEI